MRRLPTVLTPKLRSRFRGHEGGASAVEFGILAFPFLLLLLAILEIAMTFWSTQFLETAVADASRKIYTGQFQQDPANKNLTPEQLRVKIKGEICAYVTVLFKCETLVSVDVQTFDNNTNAAALSNPVDANGKYDTSGYAYRKPEPKQITIVRASMEYPVLVTMLSRPGALANGNRLIVAAATFRTEPYTTN